MELNGTTPAVGATGAGTRRSLETGAFDLQRFGLEVANEIGVDPNNLGAYGLSEQKIRSYETQLHSGTQQGGGSR